jgi:aerobic carbon-monoxide dehydrogenase medium subunit
MWIDFLGSKEHSMYAFEYQRPASRADAVAAAQGEARYLAGGQSLVQAMKLRLSSPERLVDLGSIAELKGIRRDGNNLVIGAMTTHAAVASSAEVRQALPALADLAEGIGDPMVRNMGTLGGSIANADPAADYPAALVALGATIQTDKRSIAAEDFFKGLYETALQGGELIVSVSFPMAQRAAYAKLRQPASRFALVGVFVAQGPNGPRVAVTGAGSSVFRVKAMEDALAKNFAPDAVKSVKVPTSGINSDMHGTAEYRAAMITVMAQRAVAAAARA